MATAKNTTTAAGSSKILIGPVRFSYANVWKPKKVGDDEDSKEKYGASLIIPKTEKDLIRRINKAISIAIENGKDILKGKTKGLKMPLRDGDEDREGDGAYEGMMFINANSEQQPGIVKKVNGAIEEITDPGEFYSGCWGYASVSFFVFNRNGNRGVAAGLNHVLKSKDGERLSGRDTAENDFSDLEVEDTDEFNEDFDEADDLL